MPGGDDLGGLGPVDARDRVDGDARERLGPLDGQLLDLHAALGRAHGEERAVGAVEQEREVVLLGDVAGLGDEHAVHRVALDVHAEDRGGLLAGLLGGLGELHPARLAAPARLHLGLDDHGRAQLRRDGRRRVRVLHGATRQHRHSVGGEEILRLVLVQVHWLSTPLRRDSSKDISHHGGTRPEPGLVTAVTLRRHRASPARQVTSRRQNRRAARMSPTVYTWTGRSSWWVPVRYALRTFGTRAGLWGLIKEGAWLAAHIAVYPGGALREQLEPADGYRTDPLSPLRRSLVVTDPEAAGTPILLIHGIMDNRSVFTVFRRALRRRGFGVVHAVNYGLFTGDLRHAAHELRGPRRAAVRGDRRRQGAHRRALARRRHRALLRAADGRLGARRHARHAGQPAFRHPRRLPHPHGARVVSCAPARRRSPSWRSPPPAATTRFLVVWSRMDQMVVPQRNARLQHPDLDVVQLELRDVGHLALPDRRPGRALGRRHAVRS